MPVLTAPRSIRLPVSLWDEVGLEATFSGRTTNGYVVQRLKEAVEADRAERRRREREEAERLRLVAEGQAIYGITL